MALEQSRIEEYWATIPKKEISGIIISDTLEKEDECIITRSAEIKAVDNIYTFSYDTYGPAPCLIDSYYEFAIPFKVGSFINVTVPDKEESLYLIDYQYIYRPEDTNYLKFILLFLIIFIVGFTLGAICYKKLRQ